MKIQFKPSYPISFKTLFNITIPSMSRSSKCLLSFKFSHQNHCPMHSTHPIHLNLLKNKNLHECQVRGGCLNYQTLIREILHYQAPKINCVQRSKLLVSIHKFFIHLRNMHTSHHGNSKVVLSLLNMHRTIKIWGKKYVYVILTPSLLDISEQSVTHPGHFTLRKHCPVPSGYVTGWTP